MGKLGFRPVLGLGPTPLMATFLARGGGTAPVIATEDTGHPRGVPLHALPLEVLGLSGRELQLLEGLGIATVGGLLRLPRAGLARRLGPALVSLLDRALGRGSEQGIAAVVAEGAPAALTPRRMALSLRTARGGIGARAHRVRLVGRPGYRAGLFYRP